MRVPGEAEELMAEARRALGREDFEAALRLLERIPEGDSLGAEALHESAFCHISLGRPARALDCYDRALRIKPGDPDLWNDRAFALLELGRYRDALESAEKALELSPSHYAAACNSARALLELGDHYRALELACRAVALNPLEEDGLFLRAEAARRIGRRDEAADFYRRVLKVNPHNMQAVYRLGQLDQYREMERARRWEGLWERWSGLERLPFVVGFLLPGILLVSLGALVPTIKGGNVLLFRGISISVGVVLILISVAVMLSGRGSAREGGGERAEASAKRNAGPEAQNFLGERRVGP